MRNKILSGLFLLIAARCADGQTGIGIATLRCQSTGSAAVVIPVAVPGSSFVTFSCAALDPNGFTLDKSTTPWTVRLVAQTPVTPSTVQMHAEIPTGIMNGASAVFTLSATPSATGPVLVFRNGLLLSACVTTPCAGDYQIAGTSITFLSATQTSGGISAIPGAGDLLEVVYWH